MSGSILFNAYRHSSLRREGYSNENNKILEPVDGLVYSMGGEMANVVNGLTANGLTGQPR